MSKLNRILKRFSKNEKGNLSVSFGLAMIPMTMALGAAYDLGRQVDAKQSLVAALDSAVLAGTKYLFDHEDELPQALKVAEDFFNATISKGKFKTLDIKFKLNKEGDGIAAYGNTDIATTLLKTVGIEKLDVLSDVIPEAASASIVGPNVDLEVAMMLDVTSSMCDDGAGPCKTGSKISALKASAADLIDTLMFDNNSKIKTRFALVPFSTRVRVAQDGSGGTIMNKLTDLNPTFSGEYKSCLTSSGGVGGGPITYDPETGAASGSPGTPWQCHNWGTTLYSGLKIKPCVTDRYFDAASKFDTTDTAPGPGFWINAHDGSRRPLGPDSSTQVATSGQGTVDDPAETGNYNADGSCADIAESNEVVPLTDDKNKLISHINSLEGFGSTSGALGTAFSWYMLSPEWSSVWGSGAAAKPYADIANPGTNGKRRLRKVAILMTDGSYNTKRGWKNSDVKEVSDAAVALCQSMKAKGIEVFTVGFELDSLPLSEQPTAQDTLSSCANSPGHYYNSKNPAALKLAFKTIADQISNAMVRLTR
jgi:Flp pilus assembly protein TadG